MMDEQTWALTVPDERDHAEMLELTRSIHGEDSGLGDPDYFRWLTQENPAGRAIMRVAKDTATDRIIAMVWGIAVQFRMAGVRRTGYYPLNLLVHPDYRRGGIISALTNRALEDYAEKGASFAYGAPGPALQAAWCKFEGVRAVGRPPLLVLPFEVRELLGGMQVPAKPLHGLASAAYGLVRPLLGNAGSTQGEGATQPEEIATFDGSFDRFWDQVKTKYAVIGVRDMACLQWRYIDAPLRQYQSLACRDQGGQVLGYIVFRNVSLGDLHVGMIIDLLVDPSSAAPGVGQSLVAAATEALRQAGVAMVVSRMLHHTDEYRILRRAGFLPCPSRFDPWPITVLLRTFSQDVAVAELDDLGSWFYSLGDWGIDAFSA